MRVSAFARRKLAASLEASGASSWLWPSLLLMLLGLLAFLQWRWTGEVARAEKTRLERGLEVAARRFEADFEREISRLFFWFQGRDDELGLVIGAWRAEAPYPDLLRDVLVLEPRERELVLARFDEPRGELVQVEWSPELASLRATATAPITVRRRRPRGPIAGIGPEVGGAPTLLVPGRRLLVIRLDRQAFADSLLPELANAYFPSDPAGHDLVIVDRTSPSTADAKARVVFATGSESALENLLSTRWLDTQPPLAVLFRRRSFDPSERRPAAFGPWRYRLRRDIPTTRDRGDGPPGQEPSTQNPVPVDDPRSRAIERDGDRSPPGDWLVYARHRQGSLDRAIGRLRARNLTISFGILAVLGGAGAFLVMSTRRARALARQQLDFVAGLTHELHTPLAAIEGASANLADGVVYEPSRVREYGQMIGREGRRLHQMVDHALELAGVRSGQRALDRQPVDVHELFEKAITDHRQAIDRAGIEITVDIEPNLGPISGDFGALRRVLDNLVGNAIKYGGDRVRLSARRDAGADRPMKDRNRTRDTSHTERSIVLEIADNGTGIDDTDRQHLFEPFYRGAAARESTTPGSGLGLHLARELVTRMNGEICALSRQEALAAQRPTARPAHENESAGAVFRVVLPAAIDSGDPGAPTS